NAENPDPGIIGEGVDVSSWQSRLLVAELCVASCELRVAPLGSRNTQLATRNSLMSFAKLMQRFKGDLMHEAQPTRPHDPLRLASAEVLLEIGYADGTLTPDESTDLLTYLKRAFALSDDDASDLVNA